MVKTQSQTVYKNNAAISNKIIAISVIGMLVSLIVIIGFNVIGPLSSFFAVQGAGDSTGLPIANVIVKLPFILGGFLLAYGLGLRVKDKSLTIITTILGGALIAYIVSIPVLGYVYFFFNYTR